jgi:hypothetical protein
MSKLFHLIAILSLLFLGGCEFLGFMAGTLDNKKVGSRSVEAEYTGLAGKRVAVLVSADDMALYRFPRSTYRVTHKVTQDLAENLPEARFSLPQQLTDFTQRDPYWVARRPASLMRDLGVDRLIIIDLNEYRTNEPGNEHVWQGVIDGYVSVYEADTEDPDNRVYEKQVRSEFPDASKVGEISGSDESVEAGMLQRFGRDVAWLFYDHKEPKK